MTKFYTKNEQKNTHTRKKERKMENRSFVVSSQNHTLTSFNSGFNVDLNTIFSVVLMIFNIMEQNIRKYDF